MSELPVAIRTVRYHLPLVRFMCVGGGAAALLALLLSPELFGHLLSSDGHLESHTVFEIQAWRIATLIAGTGLVLAALLWKLSATHPLRAWIERDYATWLGEGVSEGSDTRVTWIAAILLALSIVVAAVVARWSVGNLDNPLFRIVALESGVIETLQALFLFGAGGLLGWVAWAEFRSGIRTAFAGLGFALLLVFGAGEEISWGQHWLGFETPEAIAAVNIQGEFNFHNIGSYWMNHAQVVLLVALAAILPILGVGYPQIVYVLDRLTIPSAPPAFAPLVIVAATLDEHDRIARLWGDPPWRLSEGRELVYTLCLLLMVWLMARARKARAA